MIQPTIGRVVLFYPAHSTGAQAAMIANVNPDGTVNLGVLSPLGQHAGVCNVPLIQDRPEGKLDHNSCTWMAYQKGQAAKTESVPCPGRPAIPSRYSIKEAPGEVLEEKGIPADSAWQATAPGAPAQVAGDAPDARDGAGAAPEAGADGFDAGVAAAG